MSITFDTNIAIHAFDPTDPVRHAVAASLVERLTALGGPLPRQICGELLAVAHRKKLISAAYAREIVQIFERQLVTVAAEPDDLQEASLLAERHKLQFWDSLICIVARKAGATILFSEDMHDGLRLDGLRLVNPFNPANAEFLKEVS